MEACLQTLRAGGGLVHVGGAFFVCAGEAIRQAGRQAGKDRFFCLSINPRFLFVCLFFVSSWGTAVMGWDGMGFICISYIHIVFNFFFVVGRVIGIWHSSGLSRLTVLPALAATENVTHPRARAPPDY